MSTKNKFMIYKIKIVHGNGKVEYRNDSGYSVGNYCEMKELFSKVEQEVCSKDCRLLLLGVDFRGDNKLIKERNFTKSSDEEKRIYETSFVEYAKQIQDILNKMKLKKDYHYQMLDAVEKKDSIIDHRIETFEKKQWDSQEEMIKEKLKIFDESESIKRERRLHKDELEIFIGIKEKININEVLEAFKVESKNTKFKYLDEDMVGELGIMKEVYFSSDKDRVMKLRVLKKQYDRVKVDILNRKIICYNKSAVKNLKQTKIG